MQTRTPLLSRADRIPRDVSFSDAHHALLRIERDAIEFWLSPSAPDTVRLATAVRMAQIEMQLAELAGFPLPAECRFGWNVDEEKAQYVARELNAPLLASRAAIAWLRRAECTGPNDQSFYGESIFGAADYRPLECQAA